MSSQSKGRNWWKISTVTLLLVIGLLSSTVVFSLPIVQVKARVYTVGLSEPTSSLPSISKGQTLKLTVYPLNGSAPFTYSWSYKIWYADGNSTTFTVFSTQQNPTFTLQTSCEYINFLVRVTDGQGMSGSSSTTVWDPTALSMMTLAGGPVPGAPSYTVWTESGSYYAKDAWGNISFTSTVSSTVFASVISAAAANSKIVIADGTYPASFTINKRLLIEGQSNLSPAITGTITITSDFVTIRDLYMSRSGLTGSGIVVNNTAQQVKLENIRIDGYNYGLEIAHGVYGLEVSNCYIISNNYGVYSHTNLNQLTSTVFFHDYIGSNTYYGVELNYGNSITFDTCTFELNGQIGAYTQGTSYLQFYGCYFEDNPSYDLYVDSQGLVQATNLLVSGCSFYVGASVNVKLNNVTNWNIVGSYMHTFTQKAESLYGQIDSATSIVGSVSLETPTSVVSYCPNALTRAQGVATSISNGTWVTTGLWTYATGITLSTFDNMNVWVNGTTSTQFQICFTLGGTHWVSWQAYT